MKKITALTSATLATLLSAAPAFAQVNITLCPEALKSTICNLNADQFGVLVSNVVTTLLVIAVIISVIVLVYGGIKWILSGGDKAKVESARSTIIGGIIGLVLAFLAFFIITLVAGLFGINIQNLQLPSLLNNPSP